MNEKRAQEKQRFEDSENQGLGNYCRIFSAKTPIEGQDGGVVTSLLIKGLKEGLFDAVIAVKQTKGYNAQAIACINPEEVLSSKGTKYLKINVLPKLRELAMQGKRKIAVTCTPCQAKAARKVMQSLKQQFPDLEVTLIGLFCFEAFDAEKLKEETRRVLNVDLDRAERTQIRKGKCYVYVDGQEFSCKIRELDQAVNLGCRFCGDFTAEFADVSVGSVGSSAGFSTVIVRSVKGEEMIKGLDAVKAEANQEEIVKLSKFKAERAQKNSLIQKS
ncbi:MAG: Coenzyme F420 hydrogenase/dehydrogenase, beta subunit C-terminal domain [Candidatus Bathyarchaeia archaeon]